MIVVNGSQPHLKQINERNKQLRSKGTLHHIMAHKAEETEFSGVPSHGGTDGLLLSVSGRCLPNS